MRPSAFSSSGRLLEMRASDHDRVSAGVWSLVLIFGLLASMVAIATLELRREKTVHSEAYSNAKLIPIDFGQASTSEVDANIVDPGMVGFLEVDNSQFSDALQALSDIPTNIRGLLANVDGSSDKSVRGFTGIIAPRPSHAVQRWSIEYEPQDSEDYFGLLSSLGIEIGFVSKIVDRIEFLVDLNTTPKIRTTTKAQEQRSYFIHENGKLRSWELGLARNAGVNPAGKIMVQFYPQVLTTKLAQLEAEEARNRGLEKTKILRTFFKVRRAGTSYEFYVANVISN